MKPEHFVRRLQERVIDKPMSAHRDRFLLGTKENLKQGFSLDVLELFQKIDSEDRETFFELLRYISIVSVTSFLAVLDGISSLEGQNEDFVLLEKGEDEPINGMLTDLFIEMDDPTGQKYA